MSILKQNAKKDEKSLCYINSFLIEQAQAFTSPLKLHLETDHKQANKYYLLNSTITYNVIVVNSPQSSNVD